ncbi:hypothetical protein D3C84_957490 [compost metagenome]
MDDEKILAGVPDVGITASCYARIQFRFNDRIADHIGNRRLVENKLVDVSHHTAYIGRIYAHRFNAALFAPACIRIIASSVVPGESARMDRDVLVAERARNY